jgi:hypothetical protein
MIDVLVSGIGDAGHGFALYFSDRPFPGYRMKLDWLREEADGNWYGAAGMEGWLCPALFKYFDAAPSAIYCKAEASK